MGVTVDEFCDMLRDRLRALEGGLQTIGADLQGRPEAIDKAVRAKLDEIRAKLQAQKEHVEQTRVSLRARAQQKIAETKEAVNDWKARHDTRKLQVRADRAEAYAEDSIAFALAAIDQAEEAILDAVVARQDADAIR